MGKPKAADIDVPDPIEIINAEKEANRIDSVTPFGTSRWEGGENIASFSPEMQALAGKMMGIGMQDSQRIEPPPFLGELGSGIAGRVGERYGQSKPQGQTSPPLIQGGQATEYAPLLNPEAASQTGPPPPADLGGLEELRRRMAGSGIGNQFFENRRLK